MGTKKGPQYNTNIFSDETRQCALEGCEGVWYLRTRSGPDNKKFCSVDCCRRWHRLKGRKILVVKCKNPDCQKSFPTLHPSIRKQKKSTRFYDYCCLACTRANGPGPTTHGFSKPTENNTRGEVVNFAKELRSHVPLSMDKVNRACDVFANKKTVFSKVPPHLRFKRDEDQPYLVAINPSTRAFGLHPRFVDAKKADNNRRRI